MDTPRTREEAESLRKSTLPIAPSIAPAIEPLRLRRSGGQNTRLLMVSSLAVVIACAAVIIAETLLAFINFVMNLSFLHRFSLEEISITHLEPNLTYLFIPVLGGVAVGIIARYGSEAIRGHGIPEAMAQILTNDSRIPARVMFLKPISSAIAIGTGGPFGAEGPIIATGGALGSLFGQIIGTSAIERRTLLACGASAGMTAIFGCPVAAIMLAIELLLFEFRPRSFLPVAISVVVAAALRFGFEGSDPVFPMHHLIGSVSIEAIAFYAFEGLLMGFFAIFVTKVVYAVEDVFEKLPVHWMWWPAIGGLAVGIIGYFEPRTLSVGYENITDIVSGSLPLQFLLALTFAKFASWAIALGSGTSGGTLAPIFTIGGGLGSVVGIVLNGIFPNAGIDIGLAGLVGMAATFTGASRALLTSMIFAFEVTQQPATVLPLLAGCSVAYLTSYIVMKHTIMTEKIERRGIKVPADYSADFLEQKRVRDALTSKPETLSMTMTVEQVREAMVGEYPKLHHQGYPVLDDSGLLIGVVTRKMLFGPDVDASLRLADLLVNLPVTIYPDNSLREATNLMIDAEIGRLIVVKQESPRELVGIITRSDIFRAHKAHINESKWSRARRKVQKDSR